jgi:hypothetical protein
LTTWKKNHKLGLIFEFKAGTGKLLVCMSRLDQIADKPEANQLFHSIIGYMKSDDFDPSFEMNGEELYNMFNRE